MHAASMDMISLLDGPLRLLLALQLSLCCTSMAPSLTGVPGAPWLSSLPFNIYAPDSNAGAVKLRG